jgi:hypothetical protein
MTTKQLLLTGILMAGVTACHQKSPEQNENIEATVMPDSITVVPFQLLHGGWGFDINVGRKTRIHQQIIPVVAGHKVFQTREDALKVGENLAEKMRRTNTGFPDLTIKELRQMNIAGVE